MRHAEPDQLGRELELGRGRCGAGIEAYGGSLVNLTGSTITRNSADGDGGGIDIDESQLSAIASTISLNTANSDGGGISIEKSDVLLQSTRVTSNRASDYGGGIYDEGGSPECLTTGCAEHGACSDLRGAAGH